MIVTQTLTARDIDDPSQISPPLDRIAEQIGQVTADGAYDGDPTALVPSSELDTPTQRDRHLAMFGEQGRLGWEASTGYVQRCLVETIIGQYKPLIGPRLCARCFAAQETEAAIGVAVLNRMLEAGRLAFVGHKPVIAWQLEVWAPLALRLELYQRPDKLPSYAAASGRSCRASSIGNIKD